MNGNCHFVFGASVALSSALMLRLDSTNACLLISNCLIGSIFPDIDNPRSNMGQLTAPISTVIGKIGKSMGKVGSKHRGVFHDPALYMLGFAVSYFFCRPLIGFFIGAFTHLFLDAFNPAGIRLLGVKYINFAKFPSSSNVAKNFTYTLTVIVLLAGILCKDIDNNNFVLVTEYIRNCLIV